MQARITERNHSCGQRPSRLAVYQRQDTLPELLTTVTIPHSCLCATAHSRVAPVRPRCWSRLYGRLPERSTACRHRPVTTEIALDSATSRAPCRAPVAEANFAGTVLIVVDSGDAPVFPPVPSAEHRVCQQHKTSTYRMVHTVATVSNSCHVTRHMGPT